MSFFFNMFQSFNTTRVGMTVLAILFASLLSTQANFLVTNLSYTFSPIGSAIPSEKPSSPPPIGADKILIPTLGVDAPIVYATARNEKAFQLALRDGVTHYPGTALPGEIGNVFLFGHSSDFSWAQGDYKTVFALLPHMIPGEFITVSGPDNIPHIYKIFETKVVNPDDVGILSQETEGKALLTVQTSYPLGTALKRFIVIAELIDEIPTAREPANLDLPPEIMIKY